MFFFRETVDNVWKTLKLSDVEVDKLQRVTIKRGAKSILTVKDEIAKLGITLTPAETLVLIQKVAPTYDDTVHDWLRKMSWKPAVLPNTPAPAPVPAEAPTK